MKTNWLKCTAAALATLSLAVAAHAQYVWLDEKGVKQYSDMAPPASVPQSRILKVPGSASRSPLPSGSDAAADKADTSAGGTAASAKTKLPMTTAEQNADFLKRKTEQAEKDKKSADKAKLDADKTRNCERAREYSRALESGERITRTGKSGERYFLNDDQRAQESRETRRVLDECK
jgi:hypothetical protein